MSVVEGDHVTLTCRGTGSPTPLWNWTIDLIYRIEWGSEQNLYPIPGLYEIHRVQRLDQHRYWCIGYSFLVNPPLGKRAVADMTYIDLIVRRK